MAPNNDGGIPGNMLYRGGVAKKNATRRGNYTGGGEHGLSKRGAGNMPDMHNTKGRPEHLTATGSGVRGKQRQSKLPKWEKGRGGARAHP